MSNVGDAHEVLRRDAMAAAAGVPGVEAARLRMSTLMGADQGDSRSHGPLSAAQRDALHNWFDGPFSDAEKAVLAFAEAFTIDAHSVTPAIRAELLRHVDDREAVALTMMLALHGADHRAAVAMRALEAA